jgi:FxsC-like protein
MVTPDSFIYTEHGLAGSGGAVTTYSSVELAAPYFFLGYDHTPEYSWVNKLYQDLCAEIMERTRISVAAPVGFMDNNAIRLGADWREEVGTALATCRVFVPLYSPRYFTREECGKEWYAFAQRILDHRARESGNPSPIVPAIWTPVGADELPEVAKRIQMNHQSLGREYAREGFYTLIKNSLYSQPYVTAVQELAKHIILAAETSQLRPCRVSDFGQLRNAFHEPERQAPADRRLTVVVAAPTADRLPPGRSPEYYGSSAQDWNPYHPNSLQTIAEYAAAIARLHSYEPTVLSFEDGYEALSNADSSGGLGILLVDAWLSTDHDLSDKLRGFDLLDRGWIGTMVPWNPDDLETRRHADELKKGLHLLLPNRLSDIRTPSPLSAIPIQTLEQFRTQLPKVINGALYRYLDHAQAHPPIGPVLPQPHLSGPADYGAGWPGPPSPGGPNVH